MGWKREIEELHERSALAEALGGAEKVALQHEFGKLAGVGQYDDDGRLVSFTPANYLWGTSATVRS